MYFLRSNRRKYSEIRLAACEILHRNVKYAFGM